MENFKEFFDFLQQDNAYVLQAFIVIFVALVLDLIQRRALKSLQARLEKTRLEWDNLTVQALRPPVSLLVWAIGLFMAIKIVQAKTQAAIFQPVDALRDVVVIGALAWFLVRLIRLGEGNLLKKEGADPTTVDAISKLLRVSVLLTAVLVTLQTLGYSISGVLAFGGIGGIAVGFAAKDLLANFFGGLMIYLDRPFAVGDWVRSPDRDIEGDVEKIGWRLTVIRTFDKRPLYVPNAVFANIAVENPSRMWNRRIKEVIGIRYDDVAKMETIVRRVKDMLQNHPEIDTTRTLMVNFDRFAPSSLDFFIYTFTKTTKWAHYHEVKQDVLLRIIRIIEEEGAQIAFPTSTLHIAENGLFQRVDLPSEREALDR